jgi:hypothetical protein
VSEKIGLKPFHESIIDAINNVDPDDATYHTRLHLLANVILSTKIPKDHDEIIAAWQAKAARFRLNEDLGVVESLMVQKRAAEEAARKKKMEAYAVGKQPPGLADDGAFETPLGVRAHSIVDESGKILVVDKSTGLFVEDKSDGE